MNDSTPENHEIFTVRLSDPITTGISPTGAATLVPGDSTATVVIGASDEPHGIIEFAPQSQPIRVTENVGTVDLRLVRIMGNIGVFYLPLLSCFSHDMTGNPRLVYITEIMRPEILIVRE